MTPLEEHRLGKHAPCVRFTPGEDLVAACESGLFVLAGASRTRVGGPHGLPHAIALAPEGRWCFTGGDLVEGWDLVSRTFTGECDLRTTVTGLAWLVERGACVVAGGDGLALVDVRDFTRVRWLDRGGEHRDVAIDADRRHAITGCVHGVRAWPLDGGEPTLLEGHRGKALTVAAAPKGTLLASGGADGTVRLWDLAGRRPLASFDHHDGPVTVVRFHPRVRRLVSAGSDGQVALWDVPARALVGSFLAHAGGVSDLSWSHDGQRFVTAGCDGLLRVWACPGGQLGGAT